MKKMIATFVLSALSSLSLANTYPNKAINLIVPFPPGGGTDVMAREVANRLMIDKGWNIVVINRPGAGGNIGIESVVKAAADGYTVGLGQTSNLAINPTLYSKLSYDPEKDLVGISLIAESPLAIVTPNKGEKKDMLSILKQAEQNPNTVTYGTSGNGTVAHLAAVQLEKVANVKLSHVPYKGAAQGSNDLIAGLIDTYISSIPTVLGHIKNEKMLPVAVTSKERSPDLPDVPSLHELGFKDFNAVTWFGLVAPKGTPTEIIQLWNQEVTKVMNSPETIEKFKQLGATPLSSSAEEFQQLIKNDRIRWGEIVKESGAKID